MADKIKTSGAAEPTRKGGSSVSFITREGVERHDHFKGSSFTEALFAKAEGSPKVESSQGVMLGQKAHPFNFHNASVFQLVDPHHARSVHTKVAALVGLGFQTSNDLVKKNAKLTGEPLTTADLPPEGDIARIDTVLNPLCDTTWQDTLSDVIEDFIQTGNGFMEVRRGDAGEILGLHHIPAKEVFVVVEDALYNRHFMIQGGEDVSGTRLFARYGDRDDFLARLATGNGTFLLTHNSTPDNVSEVIHIRRPSSLSRWYGFPDWLAAVTSIELVECLTQHEYDFFQNRGVPEFMLFLTGASLHEDDVAKIEKAMKATIGQGNQHKSILVMLDNPDVAVQLEKLAMEGKSDGSQFAGMGESLALKIVSAHGVPPLLAGIQVPGKLGASNEMIQAMQAFQTLVIDPMQRLVHQTLLNTLGEEPSLGLTAADMVLNKITDAIDIQKADTTARMRQSPQEAEAEGRDLNDGVKKTLDEKQGTYLGALIDAAMEKRVGAFASLGV